MVAFLGDLTPVTRFSSAGAWPPGPCVAASAAGTEVKASAPMRSAMRSGRRARRCEVAKRAARVRLVVRLHTICPFVNVLVTYKLNHSIPLPPNLPSDFGKCASQIGNCPTLASTSSGAPSATGLPQSAPPLRAPPPKCPHRESQLSQRQFGISRPNALRKATLA